MNRQAQQKLLKFWIGHAHADIASGIILIALGTVLFIFSIVQNLITLEIMTVFVLCFLFGMYFIRSGKKRLELVK